MDGRHPYCKECRKGHSRDHRERNGAKLAAYDAQRYAADPEKVKTRVKRYMRRHPTKRAAWWGNHRARKITAPGRGIAPSQWLDILAASLGLCAYCNERRPLTLDHIEPLALGGEHDVDNAAAACKSCNSSKGDTPLLLWLARRALNRSLRSAA